MCGKPHLACQSMKMLLQGVVNRDVGCFFFRTLWRLFMKLHVSLASRTICTLSERLRKEESGSAAVRVHVCDLGAPPDKAPIGIFEDM